MNAPDPTEKIKYKLSKSERDFADLVIENYNIVEAYKFAFKTNAKNSSIESMAFRLLRTPAVKYYVQVKKTIRQRQAMEDAENEMQQIQNQTGNNQTQTDNQTDNQQTARTKTKTNTKQGRKQETQTQAQTHKHKTKTKTRQQGMHKQATDRIPQNLIMLIHKQAGDRLRIPTKKNICRSWKS